MKIFVPAGGGFGDFIRCYFKDGLEWGRLKTIKEMYPNSHIKVLASIHNTSFNDFFIAHPHVDEIENWGWRMEGWDLWHKYKKDYKYICDLPIINNIPWEKPEIYLTKEDNEELNSILNQGPYVIIAPFGLRSAMPLSEFPYLIELLHKKGYNSVVIGGTHIRIENKFGNPNHDGGIEMVENFDYDLSGCINTVNKSSIRTVLKLIELSKGFVGHCSCFNMMAFLNNIRSIIFSPETEREFLEGNTKYAWPLTNKEDWCKNFYLRCGITANGTKPKEVMEETASFFAN